MFWIKHSDFAQQRNRAKALVMTAETGTSSASLKCQRPLVRPDPAESHGAHCTMLLDAFKGGKGKSSWVAPPPRKPTWQWNIRHLKMYFRKNMEVFQCHVRFQRCIMCHVFVILNDSNLATDPKRHSGCSWRFGFSHRSKKYECRPLGRKSDETLQFFALPKNNDSLMLLMVQKSGKNQLRLVVYLTI